MLDLLYKDFMVKARDIHIDELFDTDPDSIWFSKEIVSPELN